MSQHEKNNFWMPNDINQQELDAQNDEITRMQDYQAGNMTWQKMNNVGFSVSTYDGEALECIVPDQFPYPGALDGIYLIDEKLIPYNAEPLLGARLWKQMTRKDGLASLPKTPYPGPTEEELREWELEEEIAEYDESRE